MLDLIVTMDDATSTIYSAFLVEEESTASTLRALLEVFATHGLPSSLYTDRASHYFHTAKAGEAVDKERLTQVGRALERLGIEHIPAELFPAEQARIIQLLVERVDNIRLHIGGLTSLLADLRATNHEIQDAA